MRAGDDLELGTMACIYTASAWYTDQTKSTDLVGMTLTRAVELDAVVGEIRPLIDIVLDDVNLHDDAMDAFEQIDSFVADCADASLDEAIEVLGEVRDRGHRLAIRPHCVAALMTALWLRWQDIGRSEDLGEVIAAGGEEGGALAGAAIVERGDEDRPAFATSEVWRQVRFDIAMRLRGARASAYARTRDAVHLDEVVRLGSVAMPFVAGSDKPYLMASHADALQTRYRSTGDVEDLDGALTARRRQRILFPHNEDGWLHATAMLCDLLHDRREIGEVPTDLDEIIDLNDDLLRDPRIQPEHRNDLLSNQVQRLRERWTRSAFEDDLGRAVALGRELAGSASDPGTLSSGRDRAFQCQMPGLRQEVELPRIRPPGTDAGTKGSARCDPRS